MKIMPLIIIKFFAVMEIINRCHYEVLQKTEVIQSVWIASLTLAHAMRLMAMTGTDYFLAMIMAESWFMVFGVILVSAFYLIEKLKK